MDPRNYAFKFHNRSYRKNYFAAVDFQGPEWIPCEMSFFPIIWNVHREKLVDLVDRHPFIFGKLANKKRNFDDLPLSHRPNATWTDEYGCVWQNGPKGGFIGLVTGNPLANWDNLKTYKFPKPGYEHWIAGRIGFWFTKKMGIVSGLGAGAMFDRMYFLRGFDNLMRDLASNNPHLPEFLARFQEHKLEIVRNLLRWHPDQISFSTDIGTQDRLMISPRIWRKYIMPVFKAVFQACRQGGAHVYLHSDGHLLEIVDDLKECGVNVHDPQERANTIEGIEKYYKGKICIDLDMDRQILPFTSPDALKKQVKRAIDVLNSPEGGFMIKCEIADPNIPLENVEAVCQAFEEYCVPRK